MISFEVLMLLFCFFDFLSFADTDLSHVYCFMVALFPNCDELHFVAYQFIGSVRRLWGVSEGSHNISCLHHP
jgi:hypothetical protein